MNNLPISIEKWYQLRDDRASRIDNVAIDKISKFKIGVFISKELQYSAEKKFLISNTLNILSRWCRSITIELNDTYISLYKELSNLMINNDPYGSFIFTKIDEDLVDAILVIGDTKKNEFKNQVFWIDSDGWLAGTGFGNTNTYKSVNNSNIIGASFGSCIINSELYKYALSNIIPIKHSNWISLFDYDFNQNPKNLTNPKCNDNLYLGNIVQVGCGAVGSSLSFLLANTNYQGKIHLIDFDIVKIENCSSSLGFSSQDAFNKNLKVDFCHKALQKSSLSSFPFEGDYSKFIKEGIYPNNKVDMILCLANERNIWSTIQENYPPIVFHATTNSSWGINIGRHIPIVEWCLMCRFQDEININFKPNCGSGEVQIKDESKSVLGSLPFLSPGSAAILLSEIIKMAMNKTISEYNFLAYSFKPTNNNYIQKISRLPLANCKTCYNQYSSIFEVKNKNSKYWFLSEEYLKPFRTTA